MPAAPGCRPLTEPADPRAIGKPGSAIVAAPNNKAEMGRHHVGMQLTRALSALKGMMQRLGPYVLLEVLLPGGTLFALLLFVYRNPALARACATRAREASVAKLAGIGEFIAERAASTPSLTTGIEWAVRALR